MCTITKELKKSKVGSGYKLVIKHKGDFYSPSTGLKYKVGMTIPNMKKNGAMTDGEWKSPFEVEYFYEPRMQGNTGVIRKVSDLFGSYFGISDNFDYSIVKMTLGRVKYIGHLSGYDTMIGDDILEIKEMYTIKERDDGSVHKWKFKRVKQ